MKSMDGKRTLVTGAASALGSAVVRAFVENGARVLAVDATDERVESAVDALGLADSNDVITRGMDESDLGSWWDLANLIAAFYDELDAFVQVPQAESIDSLPMAIERLKQSLSSAEQANRGEVSIVVISSSAEESAHNAARELASEGSKIRVSALEPGVPDEIAANVVELVTIGRSTS